MAADRLPAPPRKMAVAAQDVGQKPLLLLGRTMAHPVVFFPWEGSDAPFSSLTVPDSTYGDGREE